MCQDKIVRVIPKYFDGKMIPPLCRNATRVVATKNPSHDIKVAVRKINEISLCYAILKHKRAMFADKNWLAG